MPVDQVFRIAFYTFADQKKTYVPTVQCNDFYARMQGSGDPSYQFSTDNLLLGDDQVCPDLTHYTLSKNSEFDDFASLGFDLVPCSQSVQIERESGFTGTFYRQKLGQDYATCQEFNSAMFGVYKVRPSIISTYFNPQ